MSWRMPLPARRMWRDAHTLLNTDWHRKALVVFMAVALAHWVGDLGQAVQVYLLGWPVAHASDDLGPAFPWLVHSESLHYAFALVMLVGLVLLRPGFQGRAYNWWTIALGIQAWCHYEHLLLLIQAHTGSHLLGLDARTSVLQLVVPQLELDLLYDMAVLAPMMVAVVVHSWPRDQERAEMWCTCGVRSTAVNEP